MVVKKQLSRKSIIKKRSLPKRSPVTKGWKNASPKGKKDRTNILNKCGPKCFLSPKNLKFPICTSDCIMDCRGIAAAKIRASQYKYTSIRNRATVLYKNKCKKY